MTLKRWKHDGPNQSSQPYFHTWEAFQGKAYPNPASEEDRQRDQERFDRDCAVAQDWQDRLRMFNAPHNQDAWLERKMRNRRRRARA